MRSERPFNAETPPALLADALVTPTDVFYVRHHLPVPAVDEAGYAVAVRFWGALVPGGGLLGCLGRGGRLILE